MVDGIETLLTQNISALAMAGGFLWYLSHKDKQNKEAFDGFNKTIQNHLNSSTKAQIKLAKNLQQLTDCIKTLSNRKK